MKLVALCLLVALQCVQFVAAGGGPDELIVGPLATGIDGWDWPEEETEFEGEEEEDLFNPIAYNGEGFFFSPVEINKMVIGCAMAEPQYCPSFEFEQWKKILDETVVGENELFEPEKLEAVKSNHEDDPQALPRALQGFASFCLGEPERQFWGQWQQPDGIFFVSVGKSDFCQGFASKYPFYCRMTALETLFPNVGAAFEEHENYVGKEQVEPEVLAHGLGFVDGGDDGQGENLLGKPREDGFDENGLPIARKIEGGLLGLRQRTTRKRNRRQDNPIYPPGGLDTSLLPDTQLTNKELVWKATSDDAARKFKPAAKRWERRTCVRFQQIATGPGPAPSHGINVEIGGGAYAASVRSGISPRRMRLGKSVNKAVVAHEIGHALGLLHTQQRSDRDTYLTYTKANLMPSDDDSQYQIHGSTIDMALFDWNSIMLYNSEGYDDLHDVMVAHSLKALKKSNTVPAYAGVWPKGSWDNPQRVTKNDLHGINLAYDCYAYNSNSVAWTPGTAVKGFDQCKGKHWFGFSHAGGVPLCFSPMPAGSDCKKGEQCSSGTCTKKTCT